ncbi:hypothetical protein [Sorangium sp. So ce1024]|uniref:hypothetical protein n=1 Tax=Sorangium sp. So ce1024 TaxID=3133327 RepID=UPI003F0E091C
MRRGTLLLPFSLLLGACGGSSSETPWPAEPQGPVLGPADEASPADGIDPSAPPDGSSGEADAGR